MIMTHPIVLCWLWKGPDSRRQFLPEHVNVLRRMVERNLTIPHIFTCITDLNDFDSRRFDREVQPMPTPRSARMLADLKSPEGDRFPSCYRRLWTFSEEAAEGFGNRDVFRHVLTLDVDVVITGSINHLLERTDDFVGVRPLKQWGNANRVAGGMHLLRSGSHVSVWDDFVIDPTEAIQRTRELGFRGSDQAWISRCLGENCATYGPNDGLYSIRDLNEGALPLPEDACLVQFNGPTKPWNSSLDWVSTHWR